LGTGQTRADPSRASGVDIPLSILYTLSDRDLPEEALMETVDVVTLRTKLGQILDRVLYQHARLTITKNGTAVAALIPLADLHAVTAVSAVSTARLPAPARPPRTAR
jgi:prevent-host-death family protein